MVITLEQYIRIIVPSGSVVLGVKSGSGWANYAYPDEKAAAKAARTFNAEGKDVYIAIGSYGSDTTLKGNPSRKESNVRFAYSHFLDIDVGPGKPYPTLDAAMDAFIAAAQKVNTPSPSVMVYSGNGMRPGWTYGVAVMPVVWKEMAKQLVGTWQAAGLKLDTVISSNITAGIRLPGQFNYKDPNQPKLVSVGYMSGQHANITDMQRALNNSLGGGNHAPVTDLLRSPDPVNLRYTFAEAAKHCPVLEHTLQTHGAHDDEPTWMLVLQLLACAEDGREWVHEVSKGHPSYAPNDTDYKWSQRFGDDGLPKVGPTLCRTFNAPQCQTCPHRYKINTPAKLGMIQESSNDALLPDNYIVNGNGTLLMTENKEGKKEFEKISNVQFQRGYLAYRKVDGTGSSGKGEMVLVASVKYADRTREVTYPANCFNSPQAFKANATKQGIFDRGTPIRVMHFMQSWIEKLEAQKQFTQIGERLGWIEADGKYGFVLPDQIFWDGTPTSGENSTMDPGLRDTYACKGKLEVWRDAAQILVNSGSPEAILGTAMSFAAPLVHYTTVAGGILSLNSESSGTGKSTAMELGASIWGSPRELISLQDDTTNSVMGKIAQAPNLPVFWDEIISNHSYQQAQDIINQVFRISQGRDRSRMRIDRSIVSGGEWNTLMCVASNYSVMDTLRSIKGVADADMMRLVEVTAPKITPSIQTSSAIHDIQSNYGHAGRVYAQFLTAHAESIKQLVSEMQQHAMQHVFGGDTKSRFWAAMWACLKVSMAISSKLNLIYFNENSLLNAFVNAATQQVIEHQEAQSGNAVDVLLQYIARSREHYASFEHQDPSNLNSVPMLKEQPRIGSSADILNYLSVHKLLISITPFREWLTVKSYNATAILKGLRNTKGCTQTRGTFGRGSPYSSGRQQFFIIDVGVGEFKQASFDELQ